MLYDTTLLANGTRVTVTVAVTGEDTGLKTRLGNKKGLKSYKSCSYCWHCLHAVLKRYLRGERHGPGELMSQTLGEKDGCDGIMASDDDGEYSEICYEDMIARPSSVLCDSDSDDELSSGERAAKRRRIENIALDYLEGEPIFIMSASLRGPFEYGWVNPWDKKKKSGVLDRHEEAIIPETPDDERSLSPARDVFEHDDRSRYDLVEATPTRPFRDAEEVPETPTSMQRWIETPASTRRPTRCRAISGRFGQLSPSCARLEVGWMDICSPTANEGCAGPRDAALGVMEEVGTSHNAPSGNLATIVRTMPNSSSCDSEPGLHGQSAVNNGSSEEIHDRREVQQDCSNPSALLHVHAVPETLTGETYFTAPDTMPIDSVGQNHDSNDAFALHDTVSGYGNSQETPPGDDLVPADTAPDKPLSNINLSGSNVKVSGRPLPDIMEGTEIMNDQSPPELMSQARSHTEVTQALTLTPTRQRSISSSYTQDPNTSNPIISDRAPVAQNASEVPLLDQDRGEAKRQMCVKAKLRASSTILNNKSNSLASLRRLQSGKQKARQCSTVPPTQSPDLSGGEPQVTTRRRHDLRGVRTVPSTRLPTPRLTRRAVSMVPTSIEPEDVDPRITLPSIIPPSIESEQSVMIQEDMVPNSQTFENSVMIEDKNGQKGSPAKFTTYERLSRTAPRPLLTKHPTSPFVQQPAYSSPPLYPVRNVSADTWLQKKDTTRIRRYMFKNLPSSPTTEMFIPEGKGPGETLPIKKTVPREGQRQDSARVEDAHEESPLRRVEQLLCNVIEDDAGGESEMVTEFADKLQKEQARWQFMYAGKPAIKGKRRQNLERTDDGDLHSRTSSLVRSQRDIFNVPNSTPDSSSIRNVAPTRPEHQPNPAHTSQVHSIIKPGSAGENASINDIFFQITSAQKGGNGDKRMPEARQDPEINPRTHAPRAQERPENELSPNSGVVPVQTSFYSARENSAQNRRSMIGGNVSAPQVDLPPNSANAGADDEETRPANHFSRRTRRGRKRNRNDGPANALEAPSIQPFKLATSQSTTKADSHAPAFSQDRLMGDEELNQAMRDAGSYLEDGRFDLTKELREVGDDQTEC